jgi:steroid delta-isomerase-like uncharacterized protein
VAIGDERILFERYIYDLWNQGDVDVADEVFAPHHVFDDVHLPRLPRGPEGVKERYAYYRRAIPGSVVSTEWVIEEGHTACRWVYEGVHRGDFGVYPPTGKPIVITGVHICSFRDGRIQRSWVMWDRLGALAQIDELFATFYLARETPWAPGGPGPS